MIVKIYAVLWAVIGVSAVAMYAGGEFTALTAIVYGFICFGMTFMGMLAVLPATFHNKPHQVAAPVKRVATPDARKTAATKPSRMETAPLIAKTA